MVVMDGDLPGHLAFVQHRFLGYRIWGSPGPPSDCAPGRLEDAFSGASLAGGTA